MVWRRLTFSAAKPESQMRLAPEDRDWPVRSDEIRSLGLAGDD